MTDKNPLEWLQEANLSPREALFITNMTIAILVEGGVAKKEVADLHALIPEFEKKLKETEAS